jgi:diguanylate cyclase (GGDEF)-like protein
VIENAFDELNPDILSGLLGPLLGESCQFALCDASGQPVWTNEGTAEAFGVLLEKLQREGFAFCDEEDLVHWWAPRQDRKLWYLMLKSVPLGEIGYLVGTAPKKDLATVHTLIPDSLNRALLSVGKYILEGCRLTQELNEMAKELAGRFEELNLLYSMDDKVRGYDPSQGRMLLLNLVEECGRYLDVDAVSLLLPDTKLEVRHANPASNGSAFQVNQLLADLEGDLYKLVKATKQSVVLNNETDPRWGHFRPGVEKAKVVASPIFDVKANVCGMLAITNHPSKPEFTNGDRKLIEVLTEQATAVVQASHDALTGLLNRRGFEQRLEEAVESAQELELTHSLVYMNLDQFKVVNETSGYSAGDELLKQIAGILRGRVREANSIGRVGGDEFAILLEHCTQDDALRLTQELLRTINEHRFAWDDKIFDTGASFGVAPVDPTARGVAEVLGMANTACFLAHQQGRNCVRLYQESDATVTRYRGEMQWVQRINKALEENRFVLFAQAIAPVRDDPHLPPHYEILLRLRDEQGKLVPPFAFIPAAERYKLMPAIDRWVVDTTLDCLQHAATHAPDVVISCAINLSGQSLTKDFFEFIGRRLEESGIAPQRICFEITETAVIASLQSATELLVDLRERGCQVALDDFGSGLSSFSYLKNLPVDYLKIDGAFVKGIVDDPVSYAMVESINHVGQVMGLRTIAEFVEDDAILEKLAELGVDYAQGYGIGKPGPFSETLEVLLGARRVDPSSETGHG